MTDINFDIGGHLIGRGMAPLFLPDIGTFFNQDMDQAAQIVSQLSTSGVTVIKGEILHSPEICLKSAGNEKYWGRKSKQVIEEDYHSLIVRKVVSLKAYEELFSYCHDQGMQIVTSAYDFEGVDFAKSVGVAALKVASSNITHQPLVEHMAGTELPLIIDTGHSTLEEAARAVNWAQDAGAEHILIEHSPLPPPNPIEMHNLHFMETLGSCFGLPFGLSDHHAGEEMLYAAIALGACVLEKGVCPDAMGDEQDSGHALSVSRVSQVLRNIHNVHAALGDGIRRLSRNREKYVSRMGLVANRNLKPGDEINFENVTFAFPAKGIEVEHWGEVRGWELVEPVDRGEVIGWQHVRELAT
jgi:sialic acid synthase SpsE